MCIQCCCSILCCLQGNNSTEYVIFAGSPSILALLIMVKKLIKPLNLISCGDFGIICQNFYTAYTLKDLFYNIHPKRITYACCWPY